MSDPTGAARPGPCASVAHLQARFLDLLPRIETHARIRFRYLRCPGKRQDAVAETVAVAWNWCLRLAAKGKDAGEFVSTLADLAVRHVRSGRRLCGQERAKDVLSPRAQRAKGFRVEALPACTARPFEQVYGDPHGQDAADAYEDRLRDGTQSPPDEQAAFRVDFPEWLSRLGERTRRIAQDMTLDIGTLDLASRHRLSPARISQLRRELHANWLRFHGEPIPC